MAGPTAACEDRRESQLPPRLRRNATRAAYNDLDAAQRVEPPQNFVNEAVLARIYRGTIDSSADKDDKEADARVRISVDTGSTDSHVIRDPITDTGNGPKEQYDDLTGSTTNQDDKANKVVDEDESSKKSSGKELVTGSGNGKSQLSVRRTTFREYNARRKRGAEVASESTAASTTQALDVDIPSLQQGLENIQDTAASGDTQNGTQGSRSVEPQVEGEVFTSNALRLDNLDATTDLTDDITLVSPVSTTPDLQTLTVPQASTSNTVTVSDTVTSATAEISGEWDQRQREDLLAATAHLLSTIIPPPAVAWRNPYRFLFSFRAPVQRVQLDEEEWRRASESFPCEGLEMRVPVPPTPPPSPSTPAPSTFNDNYRFNLRVANADSNAISGSSQVQGDTIHSGGTTAPTPSTQPETRGSTSKSFLQLHPQSFTLNHEPDRNTVPPFKSYNPHLVAIDVPVVICRAYTRCRFVRRQRSIRSSNVEYTETDHDRSSISAVSTPTSESMEREGPPQPESESEPEPEHLRMHSFDLSTATTSDGASGSNSVSVSASPSSSVQPQVRFERPIAGRPYPRIPLEYRMRR